MVLMEDTLVNQEDLRYPFELALLPTYSLLHLIRAVSCEAQDWQDLVLELSSVLVA